MTQFGGLILGGLNAGGDAYNRAASIDLALKRLFLEREQERRYAAADELRRRSTEQQMRFAAADQDWQAGERERSQRMEDAERRMYAGLFADQLLSGYGGMDDPTPPDEFLDHVAAQQEAAAGMSPAGIRGAIGIQEDRAAREESSRLADTINRAGLAANVPDDELERRNLRAIVDPATGRLKLMPRWMAESGAGGFDSAAFGAKLDQLVAAGQIAPDAAQRLGGLASLLGKAPGEASLRPALGLTTGQMGSGKSPEALKAEFDEWVKQTGVDKIEPSWLPTLERRFVVEGKTPNTSELIAALRGNKTLATNTYKSLLNRRTSTRDGLERSLDKRAQIMTDEEVVAAKAQLLGLDEEIADLEAKMLDAADLPAANTTEPAASGEPVDAAVVEQLRVLRQAGDRRGAERIAAGLLAQGVSETAVLRALQQANGGQNANGGTQR